MRPPRTYRKPTRRLLEQGAPKGGVDEPWGAPASRAGERRRPGGIRKECVRERDRVARTHPEPAPPGEIVHRPRDSRETNAVELAKQRGDVARQSAVDERLEQHRFGPVLAFVHRDELSEDRISAFTPWPPSLDPSDQPLRPSTQCDLDKAFLRGRVEVDGPGCNMGAPRDLGHAQVGIPAARDLA